MTTPTIAQAPANARQPGPLPPAFAGHQVTPLAWRAASGMICGGDHGQIIAATIRNPADMELFMAAPALLAALREIDARLSGIALRGPTARVGVTDANAIWDVARAALARVEGGAA
jgi:hypothetical protein